PMQADAVTLLALVLAERDARGTHVLAVAGQKKTRELALPAELVHHVRALTPVGVDQAAVDSHLGAVLATVGPRQPLSGKLLQRRVDLAFEPGRWSGPADRRPHVAQREITSGGPLLVRPGA